MDAAIKLHKVMEARAKRILLVEDEPLLLNLLSLFFSKMGWEVATADSGSAALQTFAQEKFHVLLTDVDLNDKIDGIEVARQLSAAHPPLKVYIMSGDHSNEEKVKAANLGSFLPKPLDFPALNSTFCCEM